MGTHLAAKLPGDVLGDRGRRQPAVHQRQHDKAERLAMQPDEQPHGRIWWAGAGRSGDVIYACGQLDLPDQDRAAGRRRRGAGPGPRASRRAILITPPGRGQTAGEVEEQDDSRTQQRARP